MVYTAATLIFLTSVITLYALIINRKNPIMLVILIPMLLTSSAYTGYSIYALQGTPIVGLPVGKDVEIVWVEPAKPWIRSLVSLNPVGVMCRYLAVVIKFVWPIKSFTCSIGTPSSNKCVA